MTDLMMTLGADRLAAIEIADRKRAIAVRFARYGVAAFGAGVLWLGVATWRIEYSTPLFPATVAMIAMCVCLLVGAYHYAGSKGHNGVLGVCCLLLGPLLFFSAGSRGGNGAFGVCCLLLAPLGLLLLLGLRDRIRPVPRHRGRRG